MYGCGVGLDQRCGRLEGQVMVGVESRRHHILHLQVWSGHRFLHGLSALAAAFLLLLPLFKGFLLLFQSP